MKKTNKKGFTLIELLAVVVILGIIMLVATPNIIGIVNSNKDRTLIEDAKKFASTVEYKLKAGKIEKPADGKCVIIRLSYLDNSEFKNAPNGSPYSNYSVVFVKNVSGNYKYAVALIQDDSKGIIAVDRDNLYNSDAKKYIYEQVYTASGPSTWKINGGPKGSATNKENSLNCESGSKLLN
ncbi:MAG: type II secretion system protein [Bacilli bacterium]|nr:type II secretion system protein [Bacilli bacterium]